MMMVNAVSGTSLGRPETVLGPCSLPKNAISCGFPRSSNRSIFYRFQRKQAGGISGISGEFRQPNPGVVHDFTCWRRTHSPFRNHASTTEVPSAGLPSPEDCSSAVPISSRVRGLLFFVLSGIVAIPLFSLMLVFHPFVLLFDRFRRRIQHLVAKAWSSASVYPFFKIQFEGLENLPPPDSPAVYVSNHQSFLDIYTLLTLGRCFKFISKTTIFLIPIIGWAMFMMGLIPLRRMDNRSQLECLKRCIDLVRKGASVFFFPEGTRSKDGRLGPFKKGAFTVAAKTGVPVIPISLMGTGNMMPSGKEGILNTGAVKVVIHKSLNGNNADELCSKARDVIAEGLLHHGHRT